MARRPDKDDKTKPSAPDAPVYGTPRTADVVPADAPRPADVETGGPVPTEEDAAAMPSDPALVAEPEVTPEPIAEPEDDERDDDRPWERLEVLLKRAILVPDAEPVEVSEETLAEPDAEDERPEGVTEEGAAPFAEPSVASRDRAEAEAAPLDGPSVEEPAAEDMTAPAADRQDAVPAEDGPHDHIGSVHIPPEIAVEITAYVDSLSSPEARRALLNLSPPDQVRVLAILPYEDAADILDGLPAEIASDLVSRLDPEAAAHIVEELDSDVQADVLGEMDKAEADAILKEMEPTEAETVRRLAAYEDDTAGGLMNAEAFSFRQNETVGAVLRGLASEDDDFERYRGQHPYIVDDEDRLVGVVSLRGLLTSNRRSKLEKIMTPAIGVPPSTGLDALADLFEEHPFFGLPVTDEENRLVGVVSRTAVADAELERAETSSLARQGVSEELRAMPTLLRSRRRLAWLSANIVLNIIAASVISAYEHILTAVIAIAVFLPMVSDMSGCSGNQAVAVTLRELALGLVKPADAARVWLKEITVGVINGIVLGILIAIVCWIWKGNPWLGVVIGLALALNTMIAVSIGGVVPLLLKRFRQDPAVASGPLLTTVTDMAGFFLVLSLASLFMPLLLD